MQLLNPVCALRCPSSPPFASTILHNSIHSLQIPGKTINFLRSAPAASVNYDISSLNPPPRHLQSPHRPTATFPRPGLILRHLQPSYRSPWQAPYSTHSYAMSTIEDAKRNAAREAVANHYPQNPKFVGIVESARCQCCLTPVAFDALPEGTVLDVAFDGADEVDDDLNCIKGGGACLFQEKLVALQAKEFICVADSRKLQPRLLTNWPSIPIEVAPLAVRRVISELKQLGSPLPKLRTTPVKGGEQSQPVKTDQDFFLIDAPFPKLLLPSDVAQGQAGLGKNGVWEVTALAERINLIPGVLEVGLFCGMTGPQAQAAGGVGGQKPVAAYFGMPDGSVSVRKAN
ncbi:ribose 5-phosphate isomerase A [Emergomyces africanus]|uniref:Ribose-5-phosphate isomerase n=1 Tax=Emergomyces africanus TaxID=1955775 RepID=A0A1B7P933_9EURO|nr:ribose 5-phosphate isomerase A [Emergomyces africanus]